MDDRAAKRPFWLAILAYVEFATRAPDLTDDYMTKDNLLQNGAPFLRNALQHMAAQIRMFR